MKNLFKLKEHNVTFRKEAIAALTSFFAAVYIIVVNASILSDGGIELEPLIISTILSSVLGCFLAAFISNAPLIIMPGMGINALFTYTIINTLGLSFSQALAAVLISGILFTIVAITPISKILMESIPHTIKESITIGIGLFITFLGLQKSGLITNSETSLVKMGSITNINLLFFAIMMIITLAFFLNNIKGGFLLSIILGTVLSIFFGIVNVNNIHFSFPNFNSYKIIFFNLDFSSLLTINFWISVFSLTLILIFENIGILHAQTNNILNAPEKTKKSLIAVSLSTISYSFLGCSPPVSTIEGNAGMEDGGRTGLTSLLCGFLFLASLLVIPYITLIPDSVISPVLIILGCLMAQNLRNLNYDDFYELFPCFIIIITIPLTFSIVDGIALGFILYPVCKILSKKSKKISFTMYLCSLVFLIYFIIQAFIE